MIMKFNFRPITPLENFRPTIWSR